LVAIALDIEVGVDVERIRPMRDWRDIAERFFPPAEAAAVEDEPDFFRRWTRIEAMWKACGAGLYSAGVEPAGEWTVEEIDAGPGYAAAVAAEGAGWKAILHDYGEDE
jgi:4'-phosphopantetheinyl transferase